MNRATVAGLLVVAVASTTTACASMRRMSPEEAIAARQQLMKDQGAAMRSITEKAKAGQAKEIAPDAQKIVDTAKQITKLFPEGSVNPATSRAKPEIWQKWSEFDALAKNLETKASALAAAASSGNAQATNAAVQDLGRNGCGACHTPFRGPEIKK